jgi:PKD repeat protein
MPDFAAAPTNGMAPLLVNFTNFSTGATNFVWDFGDGNATTNQQPANTYSNAGTYTVALTAIGVAGTNSLTRTNFITVTNAPPPPVVIDFAAAPTNGLAPLLVNFTNLTTGATNYFWDFGDGNTATNQNPANSYTNAGTYSVSLSAVGGGGTNSLTRTNYVVVILPPRLVITPASLNFGLIATNATAQAALTISNAGTATLTGSASISSSVFTAASGSPFSLESAAWTNLVVIFTPANAGAFTNAVVFASNGGASTNVLIGRAIDPPLILSASFNGSDFSFSFSTLAGFTYVVQYKDLLSDSAWQSLNSIPGDGTVKAVSLPIATAPQRFYRLLVE